MDDTTMLNQRQGGSSICRICMTKSSLMTSIYEPFDQQRCIIIHDVLEKVMSLKIYENRNTPKHICTSCLHHLRIAYDLRLAFDKTQKILFNEDKQNVELIYRNNVYALDDILIVEEEKHTTSDFRGFLSNLGKSVSIQFLKSQTKTQMNSVNLEKKGYEYIRNVNNQRTKNPHEVSVVDKFIIEKNTIENPLSSLLDLYKNQINDFIDKNDNVNNKSTIGFKIKKNLNQELTEPCLETKNNSVAVKTNTLKLDESIYKDELNVEALKSEHECQFCKKVFVTSIILAQHFHLKHRHMDKNSKKILEKKSVYNSSEPKPYLCQICGHFAKSNSAAYYHRLTHGNKSYNCNHCEKQFAAKSHLNKHMIHKHQSKINELCFICGEYIATTAMKYHLKLHTKEKKHRCNFCDMRFHDLSQFKIHLKRHTGQRCYKCNFCQWAFYSGSELKKHTMIHTGKKPFSCTYCDKKFFTKYQTKVHLLSHSGPHVCIYCYKGFIEPSILRFHMKHKHQIMVKEPEENNSTENHNNTII